MHALTHTHTHIYINVRHTFEFSTCVLDTDLKVWIRLAEKIFLVELLSTELELGDAYYIACVQSE